MPEMPSLFDTLADEAHARRDDPDTAHAAASSVSDMRLRQKAIWRLLVLYGPMTDEDIVATYENARVIDPEGYPIQSPSGIRTRRKECVDGGVVEFTGRKSTTKSGRATRIWAAIHQ